MLDAHFTSVHELEEQLQVARVHILEADDRVARTQFSEELSEEGRGGAEHEPVCGHQRVPRPGRQQHVRQLGRVQHRGGRGAEHGGLLGPGVAVRGLGLGHPRLRAPDK